MPTSPIPSLDFGGDGPSLLFLHANGYPPACYRPLLARLARSSHVTAMLQRPLWEDSRHEDIHDWTSFSDDLLRFLDENESRAPTTVLGHSMGGTAALRAALRQPQKFQRLILLDPVLLPPSFIALWNIALTFKFAHRLHPHIASALNRRREFDDLELLFERYRDRPTFKYMDDNALRAYIQGITRPKENGGYELIYSPEWESRVYYASIWRDMDLWRALPKLKIPTLIIRGAETDTFWESTARKATRLNPSICVKTIESATHLVPLEQPQEVFEIAQKFSSDLVAK
ncbi:MAG: alpha/beta hydrolase [Chloroflexi bacterium]|nr:alpha/beta hydrolase [Chloroflexota bacterium]